MIMLKLFYYFMIFVSFEISILKCDLSLFPDTEIDLHQNEPSDNYDKLYLFPNSRDCPERTECKFDESIIEKETFCEAHCEKLVSNEKEKQIKACDKLKFKEIIEVDEDLEKPKNNLNLNGVLIYYRNFIHTLLDQFETMDQSCYYDISIYLTKHQINKLKQFSNTLNNSDASDLIQETTDILKNMFRSVTRVKPEAYFENFIRSFISIILDSRFQLTFFSLIFAIIILTIIFRQLHQFKLSIKSLVLIIILAAFVISVVNNHMLLIQRKQIHKQQILKENIPPECFLTEKPVEIKENNLVSNMFGKFASYFKYTPTSKKCIEYHEALLIDAKQANFVETIMFTITESFRPTIIFFGESINVFYSALSKDLYFYQYMPLICIVTIIGVPIFVYMISFLSLIMFDYEFNFPFISLRKNKYSKETQSKQQEEFLKALTMLKNENERLASLTEKRLTESIRIQTLAAISNNNQTEQFLAIENKSEVSTKNSDPNESLTEYVESLIKKKNDTETYYLSKIEELKSENKMLSEKKKFSKESSSSINWTSENEENDSADNSNKRHVKSKKHSSSSKSKIISIGLSKTIKKNNSKYELESSSNILESFPNPKKLTQSHLTDNNDPDDDEDIVVILDEK